MHILIAEDEAIVARDLAEILMEFGHAVVGIADTAEEVLALTAHTRPELVLLDIHLRGTPDGIAVGQLLRERYQTPVVYLTAHADADTISRAIATAPFGYLTKPFDERTLQSTLEVALSRHQIERDHHDVTTELAQKNVQLRDTVAEMEQRTTEASVLSALSTALLRCTSLEEIYAAVAATAQQLFAESEGSLVLQPGAYAGRPVIEWESANPGKLTVSTQRSVAVGNGGEHLLDLPLVVDKEICAVIKLRLPASSNRALLAHREQLAAALVQHAALGLANVQLRLALREQAMRDPLTGLFNRRYLEEFLSREQRRVAHTNDPTGLIMLDIDFFKQVNDTWGHLAGDAVLIAFSTFLQRAVRFHDLVCRYGGEEFVVILPSTPPAVTLVRAEAIREQAAQLTVRYEGQTLPPITISAGIATLDARVTHHVEVLQRADAALYQAKQRGRNQTICAPPAQMVLEKHEGH